MLHKRQYHRRVSREGNRDWGKRLSLLSVSCIQFINVIITNGTLRPRTREYHNLMASTSVKAGHRESQEMCSIQLYYGRHGNCEEDNHNDVCELNVLPIVRRAPRLSCSGLIISLEKYI